MAEKPTPQIIERAARKLARDRGFDPDARFAYGRSHNLKGGYIIPNTTVPLWTVFAGTVEKVLHALDEAP